MAEQLSGYQKGLGSMEFLLHSIIPADYMRCTVTAHNGYF
jgi:hypothetical protein